MSFATCGRDKLGWMRRSLKSQARGLDSGWAGADHRLDSHAAQVLESLRQPREELAQAIGQAGQLPSSIQAEPSIDGMPLLKFRVGASRNCVSVYLPVQSRSAI